MVEYTFTDKALTNLYNMVESELAVNSYEVSKVMSCSATPHVDPDLDILFEKLTTQKGK